MMGAGKLKGKIAERLAIVTLYALSFLLVIMLVFILSPFVLVSPILVLLFSSTIYTVVVSPLFGIFTPAGTILLLVILIMAMLSLILKKPHTRAAACFLPGVGAVCAIREYAGQEKDEFVEFYTVQGLVLFAFFSLIFVISYVLMNIGGAVGLVGYYTLSVLFIVGGLILIYMIYGAIEGKKFKLIKRVSPQGSSHF